MFEQKQSTASNTREASPHSSNNKDSHKMQLYF